MFFAQPKNPLYTPTEELTPKLGFPSYNPLLGGQNDLEVSRGEIGCFTQTNVTSQKPLNGLVQLTAAGWENNGVTNRCVVDLVRWKQKHTESVTLPSAPLSSGEGRATHSSEEFSAQHNALGDPFWRSLMSLISV